MERKYNDEARIFVNAIKTIASKEKNLDNLESYLSMHFGEWIEKFANNPQDMADEMKAFAKLDIR